MLKKKIFMLTLVGLICSAAVVYASGLWGTYKGNSIIRLTVDGVPTKVSDVPAMNYNDRTMVPIYLLKQAGINYSWDQKSQTVDIKKENSEQSDGGFVSASEYDELNRVMQSNRVFIIFQDQIDLASLGIEMISYLTPNTSQNDYDSVIAQINRIDIDGLDNWVSILKIMGAPEYTSFQQIADAVYNLKGYLLKLDSNNANSQILIAKSAMNTLHNQLDSRYMSTFGAINLRK